MTRRILMLGAGFMQGVAIRCAKERGWHVTAVDGNPHAVCRDLADRFEPIDLKDRESLAAFALEIQASHGLDGVFTAATDFSASVAFIAESCGLPGHSLEAALNASDKLRMRGCFKAAGVPSPAYIGVNSENRKDILLSMASHHIRFPVVVKPVDNMGARGCRKVEGPESLEEALNEAIAFSRSGFAIVESFMSGPEFSLEALVFDGQIHMTGIADRHIFFPPYFIEMGHTIPSSFSEDHIAGLVRVFKDGILSLGLSHGVAKGDIKLTEAGPMVGEIAGRLSGGYMSGWTYPYSSGIDLTGIALDLAVGIRPKSALISKNWVSAERAWISIPGKVVEVVGLETARSVPWVKDVFPRSGVGDTVVFPVNNVEKCGNCLAVAPDRVSAVQAAEEACRTIFLRLEAPNPETDRFLAQGPCLFQVFPPDAFQLNDSRLSGIEQLTEISRDFILGIPENLIPALDTSRDWQGRSLRQSLILLKKMIPAFFDAWPLKSGKERLTYWNALIRGGIQGIVYIYDCTV